MAKQTGAKKHHGTQLGRDGTEVALVIEIAGPLFCHNPNGEAPSLPIHSLE